MNVFDFSKGDLPPWVQNAVTLARPLFTAATIAVPAIGGFVVGTVAFFDPQSANEMAAATTLFFQGIPDVAWGAVATIAVGYTAAKTYETVKAPPPPAGRPSPEQEPAVDTPAPAPAPTRPYGTEIME
jgi:hypothetical protein